MRGKMARSDPRPPFGLPEVPVAARTSRLSSREAGKALLFTPVRESSPASSPVRSLIAVHPLASLVALLGFN
jgi:hypothetical protein